MLFLQSLESRDYDLFPFFWRMKFNLHSTFSRLSRYFGPHFYQSRSVFTFTFLLIWLATVQKKTVASFAYRYTSEDIRDFLHCQDMPSTFNFVLQGVPTIFRLKQRFTKTLKSTENIRDILVTLDFS